MGNNMSMDWFQVTFAGNPHIKWEHLWFPVDFPLNQSIEHEITTPLKETLIDSLGVAVWSPVLVLIWRIEFLYK
jgi:hypothetical protein